MEQTQPRDRFLPGQSWPDDNGVHLNAHGAGALFHAGRYYLFGEHKVEGPIGNSAQVGVHCYSSSDLYNWRDEGIALAVEEDAASDIVRGCVIERPKVVYNARTRQFVMWFHLELKGQGYHAARAGVATSDTPTGPYQFIRSLRPNAGRWPEHFPETARVPIEAAEAERLAKSGDFRQAVVDGLFTRRDFAGGQMARDMTVFVDDDGRGYLIASAEENYTLGFHELTDDYLDFTGRWTRVEPGGHNEAPAICKHDGRYYMIASGCTGWEPNAARSFVAESIWGPWRPTGNPCVGTNPHNGCGPELTFGGQSTYLLPIASRPGTFIAMFDVWTPKNPINGGYVWLPVTFDDRGMIVHWHDEWRVEDHAGS